MNYSSSKKRTPVCRGTGLELTELRFGNDPAFNVTTCPVCLRRVKLRQDGALRRHRGTPKRLLPSESHLHMKLHRTDGGRSAAGYKGYAGDCVTRAIAIAEQRPYQEVYDDIFKAQGRTPRKGVYDFVWKAYLEKRGWKWVPADGLTARADHLPKGTVIVSIHRHLFTVIDHVIYDTHDTTRGGSRPIKGYLVKENS